MKYLLCIAIGYFSGCINPSYIIAKIHGFDIREKGSGNAGASNALILFGKVRGVACAIFDIVKAVVAIWVCKKLFPKLACVFALTGVASILGHIFPFYMKFKGGKGLACLGGIVLAFDWRVFLIMAVSEFAVAFFTNYICFVPITAAFVFPLVYGIMSRDVVGSMILFIVAPVMLYKHWTNLKRIKAGTEMPFCYLWNKEKALKIIEKRKK